MKRVRIAIVGVFVAAFASAALADDPFELNWTEEAPGVWSGVRPDSTRELVTGSAVVVIGEDGVFLFDGAGFPSEAERVVEKIKSLTDRPVTHIAISHWHGDHNLGVYKVLEEWPDAELIMHSFTAKALASPLMNYINDGLENGMDNLAPAISAALEKDEAAGRVAPPGLRRYYERLLEDREIIDLNMRSLKIPTPTQTFDDEMTISLGDRDVVLRHFGWANTKGDIVMYAPAEKILASGDIIVRPTPYGFGSYPRSWVGVLQAVEAIDTVKIIPGHGEPFADDAYVDLLIETLTLVADQADDFAEKGYTPEDFRANMDFSAVENRFTNGDAFLASRFKAWFKDPITKAAFNIATGGDNENLETGED